MDYDNICNLTCGTKYGSVMKHGVVCSSGCGDGGYQGTVGYDKDGNAVSVEVDFYGKDADEIDDPEEFCDEHCCPYCECEEIEHVGDDVFMCKDDDCGQSFLAGDCA
jgi:hypothetical protein